MCSQSTGLSLLPDGFVARRPIESVAPSRTPQHVWSQLFGDGLLTIRAALQCLPYCDCKRSALPSGSTVTAGGDVALADHFEILTATATKTLAH